MTERHALLIGINHYPKLANADLDGCLNDVELARWLLVDRFGFAPGRTRVLRDDEATRDRILAAMDELASPCENAELRGAGPPSGSSCRWLDHTTPRSTHRGDVGSTGELEAAADAGARDRLAELVREAKAPGRWRKADRDAVVVSSRHETLRLYRGHREG